MCEVANIKDIKQLGSEHVYIGRHKDPKLGKWGNPYSHKLGTQALFKTASRKEAIDSYERYLLSNQELMHQLHELCGKVLVCWCVPKSCHGHVLKKYVDKIEKGIEPTLF